MVERPAGRSMLVLIRHKSLVIDKAHILDEIRRTAAANGGAPLGRSRFQEETGIREADWYGKHWRSWGEAVTEAGYSPNELQCAFADEHLIAKLIGLIRELGRFPVAADLEMKRRRDASFPSAKVFRRLGGKAERARRVAEYCSRSGEHADVVALCAPLSQDANDAEPDAEAEAGEIGFVYLMKCGRYYKIGHTNSVGRREYELSIQMPERADIVHKIKTDDPRGIEEYWHKRFATKRMNGEWFDLSRGGH
jgi:hypothetical protein